MSNGYNRLLHGSVASSLVSPTLTFHTTCCHQEISLSHALRLEQNRAPRDACCSRSQARPRPRHHAAANSAHSGWSATSMQPVTRSTQPGVNVTRRPLHTTSTLSLRNTGVKCVPVPNMPRKTISAPPSTSLLPPQSSLSKRPNRPRPPLAVPSHPAGNKNRVGRVDGSHLSLPNSPIQERRRAEEEAVRQEKERVERMRQSWMHKLHEVEKITDLVEDFLRRFRQEEAEARRRREAAARRRQAWTSKLRKAEQIADLIESFGWSDKTSVDRYLKLHSLVERGKELERRLQDSYKKSGLNPRTREVANSAWHSLVDAFADPDLAWIQQRLDESRPGRRRLPSAREGKPRPPLPFSIKCPLISIMALQEDMVDTASMICVHLHGLRQLRRKRLQMSWSTEIYSYQKFTLPLEYLTEAASQTATRIRNGYIQIKCRARLLYHPSSPRLAKLINDDQILHHVGKVSWLSRVIVRDVRHELSQISASVLQRELFSKYQPLIAYNAYFSHLRNELEYVARGRSYGKLLNLSAKHAEIQREIRLLYDFTWLWSGIRGASSLDRYCSTDYDASMDHAYTGPPASSIVRAVVPPAQVNVADTAPWATPTPLYPLGPAIPVFYVTTFASLTNILHRFSNPERCKHLGFDTVQTPGTQCHPLVQFLTLASEHEVAVIQLGLISYFSLLQDETFLDVMKNPAILKVGVDVESQRRLLVDGPGIEVEGLAELLHTSEDHGASAHSTSPNNDRGQRISSMAARSLGSFLPPLDLDHAVKDMLAFKVFPRRIHATESANPMQFLTHLASRAYAVLRIYLMSTKGDLACSALGARPSLGPVEVYGQARNPGKSPEFRISRMKYLKIMAQILALRTNFWAQLDFRATDSSSRHLHKKRLTAYFLFTTFSEGLETIHEILAMPQVASNILAIVHDAKLPLRTQDVAILERHRKIHHEDIPIQDIQSIREIPVRVRTYTAAGGVSHKAKRTSGTTVQPAWKPTGPPSVKERRPPIASSTLRQSISRFADLSAFPSLETLPSGNWRLDSEGIPIRKLATDRLNRIERRRLQTKIRRRLDRARIRVGERQFADPTASLAPDSHFVGKKPTVKPHGQKQLKKRTTSKDGKSRISRKAEFPNHVNDSLGNAGEVGTLLSPIIYHR
ncbi:hypothetical protein PV04_03029 [Phialophora macrospora]|uniref:Uncharacterized protein n=1 Tax=Phialophora macrospora TaxID=1851006 RepID=A0A0D2GF23_9EURO|nr:hypothetical protein PV04_03029 [Phialophora macrospora]